MRRYLFVSLIVAFCAILAVPALAQQTTGNITGRVIDQQGGALPGVTVTATQAATGFSRTIVTDGEGVYRLTALPVGNIRPQGRDLGLRDARAQGRRRQRVADAEGRLAAQGRLDVGDGHRDRRVAAHRNDLVVGRRRRGREQDRGAAAQRPPVREPGGDGCRASASASTRDPTKSTQYSPQINGGNGRNVNYQIDGGDNNDDTVGGLLQLFPLEAIQEFNFVTARYKAEYGRSNGGVMNIVTKSGTNNLQGSFFKLFRDKSMNAKTETEKLTDVDKQDYRRNQFGGRFGGPIVKDKAHFFAAVERTQQDTLQSVNTQGLFPEQDGVYPTPVPREPVHGEGHDQPRRRRSTCRCATAATRTRSRTASARASAPDNWGDSDEHVQLDQREPQLGARRLEAERVHLPVRRLRQRHHGANSLDPQQTFPNGVDDRPELNTPQTTTSTSGSSATTSRGTWPAWAASATTSRPA